MGLLALLALLACASALPAHAQDWEPRGIGGGGALFNPVFNPHNDDMFVACDMSELFRSRDSGRTWSVVDAVQTQAFVQTAVRFTAIPEVLFAILWDYEADAGAPGRSTDGGNTWTRASLASWPDDRLAQKIFVDGKRIDRLVVSTENEVLLSVDGGASFRAIHTSGDLYVGGAFFDGDRLYLATETGLNTLDLSSLSSQLQPLAHPGLPAGAMIGEMVGAREGGRVRLMAILTTAMLYTDNGDPYFYEDVVWGRFAGIFRLDLDEATPAWVRRDSGLRVGPLDGNGCPAPGGRDEQPTHIGMAENEVDVAYIGGYATECVGEDMRVYRTLDGGETWVSILTIGAAQNASTGWAGFGSGDRNHTFDVPLRAINVHRNDVDRVAFSGNGFVHVTENGTDPEAASAADGVLWRQAYTAPRVANLPGAPTPTRRQYRSVGLENTSAWDIAWSGVPGELFAGFSDIRAIRSDDEGVHWSFDYAMPLQRNSTYRVLHHPSQPAGTLYAVVSGIHDLYQTSTRARDSFADNTEANRTGALLHSADSGRTWTLLRNFGRQVVWLELDPSDARRAIVSVLGPEGIGGLYLTQNLQDGAAATWARMPSPPRTEGRRPYTVRFLPTGGLIASFSVRRDGAGVYQPMSGVFFKPNVDLADDWIDRSDPGMHYWTKDVVVDPHDPSGNTLYAAVFSARNSPTGGVYRSTDRGVHWTRIFDADADSIAIDPRDPSRAWIASRAQGLWSTADLRAPQPRFARDAAYPFGHPLRVVFNPTDPAEKWVVSHGNGLRVTTGESAAQLFGDGFEQAP